MEIGASVNIYRSSHNGDYVGDKCTMNRMNSMNRTNSMNNKNNPNNNKNNPNNNKNNPNNNKRLLVLQQQRRH